MLCWCHHAVSGDTQPFDNAPSFQRLRPRGATITWRLAIGRPHVPPTLLRCKTLRVREVPAMTWDIDPQSRYTIIGDVMDYQLRSHHIVVDCHESSSQKLLVACSKTWTSQTHVLQISVLSLCIGWWMGFSIMMIRIDTVNRCSSTLMFFK